jgi:hypothetical protein
MRTSRIVILLLIAVASTCRAQVLSPFEIQDPAMRNLQQQYMQDLKSIGTSLTKHTFPYPFYLSRKLDIDQAVQQQIDQRSIRFEKYNGQTALEITGNYYASYAADRVDADHRVRQTYIDVVLPILQTAVPALEKETAIEAFAIEVSHHVRKKVMGVDTEYPENLVIVVPRELASKVIQARDQTAQQQLMLDAEVYLDTEPTILWLTGDKPAQDASRLKPKIDIKAQQNGSNSGKDAAIDVVEAHTKQVPIQMANRIAPEELREAPLHDSSPDALKALQDSHKADIEKMLADLNSTAHFVAYAPPAFIPFKQGAFLQLSMTTDLDTSSAGSQYRLAALAFDRHISHLLRPVLARLGDASQFDGIDFSTTVKVAGDKAGTYTQSVEFVLPFAALRCYEKYDCTGQQLLNKGYVLVNGERIGLELQSAEATPVR